MRKDSLPLTGLLMAVVVIAGLSIRPKEYLFSVLISAILIASAFLPIRLALKMKSYFILCGIIFIPFAVWTVITRYLEPGNSGLLQLVTIIFYRGALYFSTLVIVLAYKKREEGDRALLLALVLLIAICGGYIAGYLYAPSLAIMTLLIILYCIHTEHPDMLKKSAGYWVRLAAVTLLMCGAALGLATILKWTETKVTTLYMMTLQTLSFSPAFSNESRITSVQDLKGSDRVVLRIFARSQPSYLVGKVFQEYTNRNTWRAAGKPRIINPVEEKPLSREVREWFPRSEGNVFYLRRGEDWEDASRQAGNHMSVVITSVNTDTLFAPRGVTFALVNSENLRRDIAEVLYTNVKNTRGEYHLAANPSLLPQKNGNETDMAPYLQVPAGISEKITALGDEVAGECNTPWQTCQVFLHFFHSSFTYGAGPKSKSEHALLEDFLLGTRQGHCEFFATAMTLLLRLRGVPARYVNGFLVEEYNHLGGYYVVREKNAHAWVEAYIPEKGWMTFDPTPPTGGSGRRDSLIPLKWREFFDLIMLKVYNIKARLVLGDIKGTIIFLAFQLKAFFLWIFISPLRAVVFILAVTLFCLYRLKKKAIIEILRGRINDKRSGIRLPEEFRVIGEILTQFERLLARKKIRRAPEKTLLEFSGEIKTLPAEQQASVKEFLTHYCLLRYARESIDGQDIADLRKKLAAVKSTIQ